MFSIKMYFDYIDAQRYEQLELQALDETEYYKSISHANSHISHSGYRHSYHYVR